MCIQKSLALIDQVKYYFPNFWTVHCCWQRGHRLFCLIQRLMQHWWKLYTKKKIINPSNIRSGTAVRTGCFFNSDIIYWHFSYLWLHSPQTTTQFVSALDSAWHLKQSSITWTRQIAQVSHSTSQLHTATAFHFFSVNKLSSVDSLLGNKIKIINDTDCFFHNMGIKINLYIVKFWWRSKKDKNSNAQFPNVFIVFKLQET